MNLKIGRPSRETKAKIVTLRLTAQEQGTLEKMKRELKFDSVRDLFLFCMSAVVQLYEWHHADYAFFIGDREKGEYKEIEFEFEPDSND